MSQCVEQEATFKLSDSAQSRQCKLGTLSVSAQKPSGNGVSSADLQGEGMRSPIGHSRARALLHRGFIGAGAVLLIAAFGTDTIYYATALWQWANFSAWLITVGLIVMLLAVLLLLIDFATGRAGRLNTGSFILVSAAALLSLVNAFGRQAPSIRNLNEHPHRPELVHGRIITKNGKMSL